MCLIAGLMAISRETLYRTLSPKGNPTLKTLLRPQDGRPAPFRRAGKPRARLIDANADFSVFVARLADLFVFTPSETA
jgi:hypothetical protein